MLNNNITQGRRPVRPIVGAWCQRWVEISAALFLGIVSVGGMGQAQAAADETDTLQSSLEDTLTYDDNLFRRYGKLKVPALGGKSTRRWDVINQAAARLKVYYPVGRQEFSVDGRIGYMNFANYDYLNNLNGDVLAKWKWQLGNQWDGVMSYGYKRSMGGFTNTAYFGLDMITNQAAHFEANYWFHPSWRINGQYLWSDSSHGADPRKFLNLVTNTGMGGIYYQSTELKDSYLGLRYRHTDGFQPNRQINLITLIDNSYQENEVVADVAWKPSGKSQLDGHVGWLQRRQAQVPGRDFQGATWRFGGRWMPTETTALGVETYRQLRSFQDLTASYIVVDGVGFGPTWQVTPKISVQGRGSWEQWTYSGDPGIVLGLKTRQDTVWSGRVAATYQVYRSADIVLAYQVTQRSSNRVFANYDDNMVYASAVLRF